MDRKTIDAYDLYHEVYDAETRDFWAGFPDHILNSFLLRVKGNKVLDLGSGPGRDAVLLRDKGLDVVCVDGSRSMVSLTSRMGFESIESDFRELDFPSGHFDAVWAYSSLIHVEFKEAVMILTQVHMILKPGGILFLGLIEGTGNESISIGGSSFERYFEYYESDKVDRLLENSGFRILEVKTYKPGNHTYLNLILERENL